MRDILSKAKFYFECLKPSYLAPAMEVKDISYINSNFLERIGIKGLIFDVDNTLTKFNGTNIDDKISESFLKLTTRFKSCILTNNFRKRKNNLEENLKSYNISVLEATEQKPFPEPFYRALEFLKTRPSKTAMIGDRLLTDIAGANRLGIYTIKVASLKRFSEPIHHMFVRGFENLLLRAYQEEGHAEKTYLHPNLTSS